MKPRGNLVSVLFAMINYWLGGGFDSRKNPVGEGARPTFHPQSADMQRESASMPHQPSIYLNADLTTVVAAGKPSAFAVNLIVPGCPAFPRTITRHTS